MVSLKARPIAVGMTMAPWLAAGCPVAKPVLPDPPPTGASEEGTSTSEAGASTGDAPPPATGDEGTTTTDGATGTTAGEPACDLHDGACEPAAAPWWDPAWAHRRRIEVGGVLPLPLTDVVVPVRLGAGFEYGCARPDGADLRFVDDAGVVLAHELDDWGSGASTVAWVRVPVLEPTGAAFWLYYGHDGHEGDEPPAAPPGEVWPQALGYAAVLHFGGALSDARGQHHGEPAVADGPPYVDEGVVGRAVHYEPIVVDARAELSGSDELDDALIASESLTITAWARTTPNVAAPARFRSVLSRGSTQWSLTIYDPVGEYDFYPPAYACFVHRCVAPECVGVELDAFDNHFLIGTVPVVEHPVMPMWHHVAVTFQPSLAGALYEKRLYVDGELDEEAVGPLPLPWDGMASHTEPWTIGAGPLGPEESAFHGELDELRIATQAWSPDRIRAEHAYTGDPTLVTVGAAECP